MSHSSRHRTTHGEATPGLLLTRVDAYLGVLAIVFANSFETMDSTSPNNGYNLDMDHTGVTDPVWIGVLVQTLTMLTWFTYTMGLLFTIAYLFVSLHTGKEASIVVPTALYILGTFIYYFLMFFEDVAFWFNLFRVQTNGLASHIPSPDNVYMYVVTDVQLFIFMIISS